MAGCFADLWCCVKSTVELYYCYALDVVTTLMLSKDATYCRKVAQETSFWSYWITRTWNSSSVWMVVSFFLHLYAIIGFCRSTSSIVAYCLRFIIILDRYGVVVPKSIWPFAFLITEKSCIIFIITLLRLILSYYSWCILFKDQCCQTKRIDIWTYRKKSVTLSINLV